MNKETVNERHVKNNVVRFMLLYSARAIALMCASGSLMQTFLATLGFDSSLIYIHTTALQAAGIATIMLMSHWVDKGNLIKRAALSQIPLGLLFLVYVPIAVAKNSSPLTYLILLFVGVVQQISAGLYTVCDYKIPYYIFKPEEYGKIMSIAGIISSLVTLGISAAITYLVGTFGFLNVFPYAAMLSIFCVALSVVSTAYMKSLTESFGNDSEVGLEEKPARVSVFRKKIFWYFAPANLLRGINCGVITVLATIAFELGYNETVTTAMVTVQSVASLLSCTFMALTITRFSYRNTVFVGSLSMLSLPLLLIKNSAIFLIVYAVIIFGRTFVDYGVPAMLLRIVPVEMAGPYNAWRMALHNVGILIGTISATVIPTAALLIIAALTQLVSGVMYWLAKTRSKA